MGALELPALRTTDSCAFCVDLCVGFAHIINSVLNLRFCTEHERNIIRLEELYGKHAVIIYEFQKL